MGVVLDSVSGIDGPQYQRANFGDDLGTRSL